MEAGRDPEGVRGDREAERGGEVEGEEEKGGGFGQRVHKKKKRGK